jgi:ankyrin repeat protein
VNGRNKGWRVAVLALALSGGVMASGPAAAQFSDGYKFLEAIKKVDSDGQKVIDMMSDPSINVNTRDVTSGETALHVLVRKRNNIWIQYLTQNRANPNIADVHGVTPLMLAANMGFVEGVQSLIAAGGKVDTPNDTGETPLISAVHRKDTAMVRVLLKAGANPDRADNSGRSARDYAQFDGRSNPVLTEIENASKAKAATAGRVFGPTIP